ncbi:hypothetical protein [Amycolatopsis sp. FDAARGOS 1241]|uniref:hypothetical protein n=1 Tax=Amycolatopsis sp. FDAARGOS 1241 TaxID=2778070 RepID=UPI00194EA8C2|nr:hypothetical protein [Amycolatopsis sp. FDAARGOS 1241]QRP44383.1 hypothetical protein I6J71_34700 [Amycolatopsis sp. FDAARGOS 1241]
MIVIGGTVLIAAAVIWFLVWNRRGVERAEARGGGAPAAGGAAAWLAVRGAQRLLLRLLHCGFYNEGDLRIRRSIADELFSPTDPFDLPPEAVQAHEVVSGVQRGHPFLAAVFECGTPGPVANSWRCGCGPRAWARHCR